MLGVYTWPVRPGCATQGEPSSAAPSGPVLAYTLASTVAAAATAAAISGAGQLLRALGPLGVASLYAIGTGLILAAGYAQLRGRTLPLPQRRRQVPRRWLQWRRPTVTAAAFGLMIGSGVLTYLGFVAAYALAGMLLLAPSLTTGVALGATYGLARGGTLLVTWIGDRFVGRRPAWRLLEDRNRAVEVALVAAATVIPAVTVLVAG